MTNGLDNVEKVLYGRKHALLNNIIKPLESVSDVTVTVLQNGHDKLSSKPERGSLHFTSWEYLCVKDASTYSPSRFGKILDRLFNFGKETCLPRN